MLTLHKLKPRIKQKPRKRVGRGTGSGHGAYSGRGIKGQKARTGGKIPPGFEGGRMPFIRQIPKRRGFKSHWPKAQVVKLGELEKRFETNETVSPTSLKTKGLVDSSRLPIKIVGKQDQFAKALKTSGVKLTASAKKIILAAGGKIDA